MDKIKLKKNFKLVAFLTTISSVILLNLFILFALVVLFSNFSPILINKLTAIIGGIGIFASTYIASRVVNKKGIFLGLCCGAVISLIVFLTTLISTGIIFSIAELIKIIIIMVSSCLGGIFGANSRQN